MPVFLALLFDLTQFMSATLRSRTSLAAENIFLRKQLASYQEHKVRPRRLTDAARLSLVLWSRFFEWKNTLMIVKPGTFTGWHRQGFKLFWRWKSRPGRPRLPHEIRALIARMARENPTWGQLRVAAELSLKLGIFLSPRTVRKYWPWDTQQPCGRSRPESLGSHAFGLPAVRFWRAISNTAESQPDPNQQPFSV